MNPIRRRLPLTCLIIATGLALLICQTQVLADNSEITPFRDVVAANFHRWSGGKKHLTARRVNDLIRSRRLQGDEAAAVAAIHKYQMKAAKNSKSVTRRSLIGNYSPDSSSRRDKSSSSATMVSTYKKFADHIDSTPRSVFTNRRPNLNGMSQGKLGDCFFIAPLGSFTRHHQRRLHQMIHQNADQSFEVRFANGKQVHVPPLTDAQIALSSNTKQQGIWVNVLEIAAGMVSKHNKKKTHISALDHIGQGGDTAFSIRLLTGHKVDEYVIRRKRNGKYVKLSNSELSKAASRYARRIANGMRHHAVATCSAASMEVPPGMSNHHAYAILGIHNGYVHVWNPHGYTCNFEPKGTPGLKNGYRFENGHGEIPIHDFVRFMVNVDIERVSSHSHGTRTANGRSHSVPHRRVYRRMTALPASAASTQLAAVSYDHTLVTLGS